MPFQVSRISKDFKYGFFASNRQAGRTLKLSRSHNWWQARISALSRESVRRRDWLLYFRSLRDRSRASRCVITILNLGTVRQNQDTEKRVLCRKSERRGWRKWEGVWRKNNICGENVKNAGEKKIYYFVHDQGWILCCITGTLATSYSRAGLSSTTNLWWNFFFVGR